MRCVHSSKHVSVVSAHTNNSRQSGPHRKKKYHAKVIWFESFDARPDGYVYVRMLSYTYTYCIMYSCMENQLGFLQTTTDAQMRSSGEPRNLKSPRHDYEYPDGMHARARAVVRVCMPTKKVPLSRCVGSWHTHAQAQCVHITQPRTCTMCAHDTCTHVSAHIKKCNLHAFRSHTSSRWAW